MCIWYHPINITIVNAWLLNRKVQTEKENKPNISLFDCQVQVVISLTKVREIITLKRAKPSQEKILKGSLKESCYNAS